jgi:hypothetical protein
MNPREHPLNGCGTREHASSSASGPLSFLHGGRAHDGQGRFSQGGARPPLSISARMGADNTARPHVSRAGRVSRLSVDLQAPDVGLSLLGDVQKRFARRWIANHLAN